MNLQIYKNFDEFKERIIFTDPMKTFQDNIRHINWQEQTRECKECGTTFTTKHPAKIFCDTCTKKTDKQNKSEAVIDRIQRKQIIKHCIDCGSSFILGAPAMKKCRNCSPKGGELVVEDSK